MCGHQSFKSKPVFDTCLPFRGRSVVCPHCCCWAAPELGVGSLRFLHCPELFFECKKGCRLEFCTLHRHCTHSASSHCSGPRNLGNQRKERVNGRPTCISNQQAKPGDEEGTECEQSDPRLLVGEQRRGSETERLPCTLALPPPNPTTALLTTPTAHTFYPDHTRAFSPRSGLLQDSRETAGEEGEEEQDRGNVNREEE